ncbi:MAG: ribonuclease P protein subunit [Candidatus Bilamarchaeaceae archaeon]
MMQRKEREGARLEGIAAGRPPSLIGEFIGRRLVVLESSSAPLRGIEGKVVDETKNTFLVETKRGERRIPKIPCVFEIGGKKIAGREIAFRAEDRPRKIWKKVR